MHLTNLGSRGKGEKVHLTYIEKHIANGNAFLVTGTASETEKTHTIFVEFKNGLVDKAWTD